MNLEQDRMHKPATRPRAMETSQECAAAPAATGTRASGPWLGDLGDAAVRLAAAMPEPLRRILRALPPQPPSFVLARLLDRVLLPRLDSQTRAAWSGRVVQLDLDDLGMRLRMRLDASGFRTAPARESPAVTVRSTSAALWRLVRGVDDADRLFFERALVMEGDTEFGLLLKNTLDAIGPLWR